VLIAYQLHLVHWNCEKYKKFEDAVPSPDGLCVLTVFIEVAHLTENMLLVIMSLSVDLV